MAQINESNNDLQELLSKQEFNGIDDEHVVVTTSDKHYRLTVSFMGTNCYITYWNLYNKYGYQALEIFKVAHDDTLHFIEAWAGTPLKDDVLAELRDASLDSYKEKID